MERAMLNLANFYFQQGISVDFLVAAKQGPLLDEVSENINVIDLKSYTSSWRLGMLKIALLVEPWLLLLFFAGTKPKAVKVISGLVKYIQNANPDMILSTPTTANLAVIWARKYCGHDKKIVIREASTLSKEVQNKSALFFRLIKFFVKKWYSKANVIICVSNGVREDLRLNFKIKPQKLQTVYNILDIAKIKKQAQSTQYDSVISRFDNYILSIGRLEKQKDFETLIRAFHLIANHVPSNLVILGEGPEREKLESLVRQLKLSNRVLLPGFFVNPYPFIKKSQVLALSSRWEGCPNVLREAMVLNRKIISTNCPSGPGEILKNGKYGILIETGDIATFSAQLFRLVAQPDVENGLNAIINDQQKSMKFFKELLDK